MLVTTYDCEMVSHCTQLLFYYCEMASYCGMLNKYSNIIINDLGFKSAYVI